MLFLLSLFENLFVRKLGKLVIVRNSSSGKVMFLRVSVYPHGGEVHSPLARHPPASYEPPWSDTPSPRLPLQLTVRILLECILVC